MAKRLRTRKHAVVLNRSVGGDLTITIVLLIFGVFMFLPTYLLVITAFKPIGEMFLTPPLFYVIKPTFQNFIDLFASMTSTWVPLSRYFFNTVFISLGATVGCLIIGSMAAYSISKVRFPGSQLVFNLIVYSLMISSTVTGIAPFIIYVALNWLNTYTISIVPIWASTLGLYLMKNFIDGSIHDSMIEAARIEGCSEFRIYLTLVMPLVKPAWLTLMITVFQNVWNTGASGYVYSENLKTFDESINSIISASGTQGAGSAAAVIMMSVPIIVFLISQSKIVETMGSSGMKD
ncbi:MAG: carbohydrate ABC transporter permease [Clostridia bacterium]|nr:carbohydrate ABC transporter permease [Clostridia bacterium]